MHRFCFISKSSDFKRTSKYWKFVIFWKKHDFEKWMHSFVSNAGFNQNSWKRARFNEKPRFLQQPWKKPRVRRIYILEVTLSVHFGKIKKSHVELVFLSFAIVFLFFFSLILSLLVLFYYAILWDTHTKI